MTGPKIRFSNSLAGMKFEHYRKAKQNEVACKDCSLAFRVWYRKGLRCGDASFHQAVGKSMTCDAAKADQPEGK